MENAYAQALWQMVEGGTQPHEAVAALKKSLETQGRSALLPKIARAFERLAAREGRKNTMQLTVARKKDIQMALEGAKKVLLQERIRETDLVESVDESIVGGWRLEGRGVLIDNSWKKSLLTIYNQATK